MKRDFLGFDGFSRNELEEILHLAARLKRELKDGQLPPLLAGKAVVLIFEKPSLRTRVTFEVGVSQLGGTAVYLAPNDIRLGQRESVADIARNLERWVDLIMARTYAHTTLIELAQQAAVPVINGLSDRSHPCQVLADCFTLIEKRGHLDGWCSSVMPITLRLRGSRPPVCFLWSSFWPALAGTNPGRSCSPPPGRRALASR
jgi:ornithine carbamoyltransferase